MKSFEIISFDNTESPNIKSLSSKFGSAGNLRDLLSYMDIVYHELPKGKFSFEVFTEDGVVIGCRLVSYVSDLTVDGKLYRFEDGKDLTRQLQEYDLLSDANFHAVHDVIKIIAVSELNYYFGKFWGGDLILVRATMET